MSAPQEHILQFFAFEHLPGHLRIVSEPFGLLARDIVEKLPRNSERTVALRKLLEAKDAAVRAVVAKEVPQANQDHGWKIAPRLGDICINPASIARVGDIEIGQCATPSANLCDHCQSYICTKFSICVKTGKPLKGAGV